MVRYSKAHKQRSRSAIVSSAAQLFRQRGYNGVGIDQLCEDAGLTRGAFYAHFKSKADLFHTVLSGPHDFVKRLSARKQRSATTLRKAATRVALDYLAPAHRPQVLAGCSLAALATDTTRAAPEAQAAYAAAVRNLVDEFQRDNAHLPADRAQAAVALCVGGLLVGAACGGDETGDQIALAARKHIAKLLSPTAD